MDKTFFAKIRKSFSIEDIERQLVFFFIESNGLELGVNSFLRSYLEGFDADAGVMSTLSKLYPRYSIESLASDMELLIPDEDKKQNGAFFTPPFIVDYIIEQISPSNDAKVIDLSCGSGAFLLGLIRYYRKKSGKKASRCIKENVYGIDILGYNIRRCKALLALAALQDGEDMPACEMNLYCADSLRLKFDKKFDAVVGNPPYVKFQDLGDEERRHLLETFQTTRFGTYNLYFAFFELGYSILSEKGQLGYITPNNYFTSLSGECLRAFFQSKQCVSKIADFNCTKVFDVQTYTAITFVNKKRNAEIKYSRIGNGEKAEAFLCNERPTPNRYDDLSTKKWRLLCGNERDNIFNIEHSGDPIGKLFNICAGIATLKDEAYFIEPTKADGKYFHFSRRGVEYKIEKELAKPLVKISDAKNQSDIDNNKKWIIFPYRYDENGKATAITEEEMAAKHPFCYYYLCSIKDVLSGRSKGKQTFSPFYAYGRTQGLNRRGVKLLTPTFSKKPRFLLDANADGFFTNGYGVYLNKKSDEALFKNNIAMEENMDVLQKVLNSCVMQYYVDKTSVSIEGGYPCYQKNFIERFTIPEMSSQEVETLRSLEDKDEIDNFLIKMYHLNFPAPKRDS